MARKGPQALGVVGMIAGVGAAVSTTLAGAMTDYFGSQFAFFGLGLIAVLAFLAVLTFVPETRPQDER